MSRHPLSSCTAVVTGARSGIGRSVALELGRRGARVVAVSRNAAGLEEVCGQIGALGGRAIIAPCDMSVEDDVSQMAERVKRLGPVTVLINSAGTHKVRPFIEGTMAECRDVMAINYFGTVSAIRAFLPEMIDGGYGRIVNVASTAGKYGVANCSMYSASKHAVLGLTSSLAFELATTGVRVNAVCPGFVDTPMMANALPAIAALQGISEDQAMAGILARVPIGRLLSAEEVSNMVLYLASEEADGITGQAYTVAGGMF